MDNQKQIIDMLEAQNYILTAIAMKLQVPESIIDEYTSRMVKALVQIDNK